jgi:hypothetical protein
MYSAFWSETPNKGNNLGNILMDGRIILICTLGKYLNLVDWIICFRIDTS